MSQNVRIREDGLVAAWQADTRFNDGADGGQGREVIGAAMAWRQADALKDANISKSYALSPLLHMIRKGEFTPTVNTVLVLDEASQIGPRPMLKLLELQAKTGMTIKLLGDREQAQAIEAGDTVEILNRVLPAAAKPTLLRTMRQTTERGRTIAGLFRDGNAAEALEMKREVGHAVLVGGDRGQVVERIADLYITRRDILLAAGARRGITVSAPTNDDAAEISQAIRKRLKQRCEIGNDDVVYQAIDQRGKTYDLAIVTGDRLRLFRRTRGRIDGKYRQIGSNGDIVEVLGHSAKGLRLRNKEGGVANVRWRDLADAETGRLFLGMGHVMTIDAAQGMTSDEHINALPRGTQGVTGFTSYVAESRSEGTTWTVISEGALYEAERLSQALGEQTPITQQHLWDRAAEDMSRKPYKSLAMDLLEGTRRNRAEAIDTFIAANHALESAQLDNPDAVKNAVRRVRAEAINETLGAFIAGLDHAMQANAAELQDTARRRAAMEHLRLLRVEAASAKSQIDAVAAINTAPTVRSRGPGF